MLCDTALPPSNTVSNEHCHVILPLAMIRACRKTMWRQKICDSSGAALTGGSLLMRTLVLRRMLIREVFAEGEPNVGILLPPSVAGAVVNAAVTLGGRITANLNYSASQDVINACIERAGIRHVLTSQRVMDKLDLKLNAEIIILEDLREKISLRDKLTAVAQTFFMPHGLLERQLGLDRIKPDDVLTLIFTSGSTGTPKGVMLTHENVGSNVTAINKVVRPQPSDVLLGVLPFFHSFGYMVALWAPLALDLGAAYHFSPLDARAIGKLAGRCKATILLATPTFLRSYVKRCSTEEFAKLDVVVTGAERLPPALADAFEEKFGIRPVEGYGTTELSPLVSVNIPPSRSEQVTGVVDRKEGTVGRPIEGVSAKIVDPETNAELPTGQSGMLWIKGPNLMKGYYGEDEKTREVVRDGWYVTGDVAFLDEEGFITITGRLSRFSKIGGEMVPHVGVEELIQELVGGGNEDEILAVVTAVPDQRKGERLVVLHRTVSKSPEEICTALKEGGLSSLWIPSPDSFIEVDEIPLLGSGKTDLKGVAELAKQKLA